MRNLPAASTTVALLDVPPLSSPTATHELEPKATDSTDPAVQTGPHPEPAAALGEGILRRLAGQLRRPARPVVAVGGTGSPSGERDAQAMLVASLP